MRRGHGVCAGSLRWVVAAVALVAAQPAHGQAITGVVEGLVEDPSRAPVGGAEVVLEAPEHGGRRATRTTDDGHYQIPYLRPGTWRVSVSRDAFRTARASVQVAAGQRSRLDLRLEVGSRSETVEVQATAPVLMADSAEVATVLDRRHLEAFPTLDRNFTRLLQLAPGALPQTWQHSTGQNPQASYHFWINGQGSNGMGMLLDGLDNRDNVLGLVIINPTFESVDEARIVTQNFRAEFGQAVGGVLTVQTRAGTNAFHGSVYDFFQDNRFRARNPFTEAPGTTLPDAQRHLLGFTLGGPVLRNRLFFFADVQALRSETGQSRLFTVPTERARRGDLSEYGVAVYDPRTGAPSVREAFPGAVIPAPRLAAPALALLRLLPLPNRPGVVDNYLATGVETFDGNIGNLRLDTAVGNAGRAFARLSFADYDRVGPPSFGPGGGIEIVSLGGVSRARNRNLTVGFDRGIGERTWLEVRAGYSQYKVDVLQPDHGAAPAAEAGLPGLNLSLDSSGLPGFSIEGPYGFFFGNGCNCPVNQNEQLGQVLANLSRDAGAHSLKAGADVRRMRNLRVPSDSHRSGDLVFSEAGTRGATGGGLGLATFLLGDVSQFHRFASQTTDAHELQWRGALFVQDTWRATRRLTVDAGLRLEVVRPQTVDGAGHGGWLDLTTGDVLVAGVGEVGLDGDVKGATRWAPRLGVAWTARPGTVLRAGYGRSYDLGEDGSNAGVVPTGNPPVIAAQHLVPAEQWQSVFPLEQGPPPVSFPVVPPSGRYRLPPGRGARALPREMQLMSIDSWMASVQQLLGDRAAAELAYVGNRSGNTYAGGDPTVNVNQPILDGFPGVPRNLRRPYFAGPVNGRGAPYGWTQDILDSCLCAESSYHSLQATLRGEVARGTSLLAHYTLARAREHGRDYFTWDRDLQWGRPSWSRTHSLVVNASTSFRGWQLSTLALVQSGLPFDVTYRDAGADRDTGPNRPDLVADPQVGRGNGIDSPYFNATPIGTPGSSFARPAVGTFGNLGRHVLSGPGYWRVDAAVAKAIDLGARARLRLRLDVVNVFNHVNLGLPDAAVGVPGHDNPRAGFISSTAFGGADPQRNLQLGAALEF